MAKGTLYEAWVSYARDVIPRDASTVQVEETRRGFYAGAAAFFGLEQAALGPGAEPTPAELDAIEKLHDELQEHGRQMRKLAEMGRRSS